MQGRPFRVRGEFRSKRLGNGATVYTTEGEQVTGQRQGEMSIWTKNGRIDILLKSTFREQPDGSIRNDGTGRIIGGTGLYLAAKGRFTVLAILKLTDPYTTVRLKNGKISFPVTGTKLASVVFGVEPVRTGRRAAALRRRRTRAGTGCGGARMTARPARHGATGNAHPR
jgi:hypothetical protein